MNRQLVTKAECPTVVDFIDKYYKSDRYWGRGTAYANILIDAHIKEYEETGYDVISHYDSNNGKIMYYNKYPNYIK